jgi:superfamily I DNA and/or RNA helicase
MKELKKIIDKTDVIAITPDKAMHNFVLCFKFDLALFVQASQMYEPMALGPILLSKRFAMFGDYYTLNPVCKSAEADKLGITIPMHRRLSENHPKKVVILRD